MYRNKLEKLLMLAVCCTIFIFIFVTSRFSKIPDRIVLLEGENQLYSLKIPINVSVNAKKSDVLKLNGSILNNKNVHLNLSSPFNIESKNNGSVDLNFKLLGFIPIKRVTVNVLPGISVIPGGQSVGVKLSTRGAMIVGISQVTGMDGRMYNPALEAGIQIGDSILKLNGMSVKDSEHVASIVNSSDGKPLKVTLLRKSREIGAVVRPIKSREDGQYKIGVWIRDSTAGVGTLTFYNPYTNTFGALGHPITDVDTGELLTVSHGVIVPSKIISIQPGSRGKPGELRGLFMDSGEELGTIESNTMCGIYGRASQKLSIIASGKPIPIAFQNQIKEGPAKILTTINGNDVKEYDIVIEKLTTQSRPNSKSMIIRVTDSELLQKTGGIVQGMSGSPIIQDGKLVGAVTHVFINRPDMGYGIYIEWMLQESGIDISTR